MGWIVRKGLSEEVTSGRHLSEEAIVSVTCSHVTTSKQWFSMAASLRLAWVVPLSAWFSW
jgi:hypothetical protein